MKTRVISLFLALMMAFALVSCGTKSEAPADAPAAEASQSDAQSVSGTVDEVKDFMFVIEAEDGCFYAFDYDKANAPEGFDNVAVGASITIHYEGGELSEVDNFNGTIVSIEAN